MTQDEVDNTTTLVTQTLIYGQVKKVLVEALNAEEDEITPNSKIIADLGAESIDFLDITFRLERTFNIKIPGNELFPENVFAGDEECLRDGKMTEHGIDKLQAAAPHITLRDANGNLTFDGTVNGVQDAFTVRSLVTYIQSKVKS